MFKFFKALSENSALQGQIQLLKTEKQQLTDKVKALNKELNQTRETLGKTQIRHAQELQRYADVEIRMQKARQAYKTLRLQQQENEAEMKNDKAHLASLKAQLAQTPTQSEQKKEAQEIQALDKELKDLQAQHNEVTSENEKLKQEVKQLQEKSTSKAKKKKASQHKRILIVDDSITTRTLMKKILESAQYEVHLAKDGTEGQEIIKTTPLDIVVTDAEMPNMDGFTLTRWIKKESNNPDIPVIMIASVADNDFQAKAEEAGASSLISKNNFHQQVFLNIIEKALES